MVRCRSRGDIRRDHGPIRAGRCHLDRLQRRGPDHSVRRRHRARDRRLGGMLLEDVRMGRGLLVRAPDGCGPPLPGREHRISVLSKGFNRPRRQSGLPDGLDPVPRRFLVQRHKRFLRPRHGGQAPGMVPDVRRRGRRIHPVRGRPDLPYRVRPLRQRGHGQHGMAVLPGPGEQGDCLVRQLLGFREHRDRHPGDRRGHDRPVLRKLARLLPGQVHGRADSGAGPRRLPAGHVQQGEDARVRDVSGRPLGGVRQDPYRGRPHERGLRQRGTVLRHIRRGHEMLLRGQGGRIPEAVGAHTRRLFKGMLLLLPALRFRMRRRAHRDAGQLRRQSHMRGCRHRRAHLEQGCDRFPRQQGGSGDVHRGMR